MVIIAVIIIIKNNRYNNSCALDRSVSPSSVHILFPVGGTGRRSRDPFSLKSTCMKPKRRNAHEWYTPTISQYLVNGGTLRMTLTGP
jgi:hypothetical protein